MKRVLFLMLLVLFSAVGAYAHDGLIGLFADMGGTDCDAQISTCSSVPLYLLYIRGDGPEMASCFEFRLLKSSDGTQFLEPSWPGEGMSFGSLESGISVCIHCGDGWCSGNETVSYLGTLNVVNFTDQDTFVVNVVGDPNAEVPGIYVTECSPAYPMHAVLGGYFIFNGQCRSAENPFQWNIAVRETSWGAIKHLYQ